MNKDNIKTMTKADVDELKSGDIVYIRMRVSSFYGKEFDSDIGFLLDFPGCCGGTEHRMSKRWLHRSIMREIGTKNTETAPKYDPNRIFRKGDLVRLKAYNGRKPYDFWHKQTIEHFGAKLDTVLADELDSGNVDIFQDAPIDELTVRVHSCHLELVTPVEELEPYYVERQGEKTGGLCYTVRKHGGYVESTFYFGECRSRDEQQAKAAAEAERDRLNAEWRKAQNNE